MQENQHQSKATDLKSIGNTLKAKREENSYTLEHIAEVTRITLTNLRYIEAGQMDMLPGLVFVKGFVRNYADLLGLESDWMIEALNQAYNEDDFSHNVSVDNIQQTPYKKQNIKLSYVFSGAAFAIIVLVLIIGSWDSDDNRANIAEKNETIQALESQIVNANLPQDKAIEEQKKLVDTIISPLNLVLIGNEDEWVRLSVDSKPAFDVQLKKGERYEWPAEEVYELTMTTGNSAKIHLNGEEIEVNKQLKNQFYEVRLNKFSLTRLNN
ncbi:MAG: helix-turn-helix domain-containing protein [Deltaproteobacteria bacterium]|nr:helix-turn-helix domain-containing protein [Deltaproteobacteria bacterium]